MSERWCPYCPADSPPGPFNVEHVIPADLGGTLLIDAHANCNHEAALHVDNPLMAVPDIALLRALSGVPNTRTKRRGKGAQFAGHLTDDARALLKAGITGVTIEQVAASETQLAADGSFVFSTPTTNAEKHTKKLLDRIQRENPGRTVELVGQEVRRSDAAMQYRWNLPRRAWPRFAAKVALGAMSLVMPTDWRDSDGELFLLALFRKGILIGAPKGLPAVPKQLAPGDPFFDYLHPREHVITAVGIEGGVRVSMVLFGELRYTLGVVTAVKPVSDAVWVCDHTEPRAQRFDSVKQFVAALTERAATCGDTRHLHLDRPRGQVVGPAALARLAETPISALAHKPAMD